MGRRARCCTTGLLVVLVACGDRSTVEHAGLVGSAAAPPRVDPPMRVQPPTLETLEAPPVELPKQEQFTVITPGTGTRAALRYRLAPGTVEYRAETRLVSRQLDRGTAAPPLELPAIRDGFAIAGSAKPGWLELRGLTVELAASSSELATRAGEHYVAGWRAGLQHRRASVALDARGQLGPIAFNDDPTNARGGLAKDELAQRLLGTIVPVPDEPVGRGARWRVTTVLRQNRAYVKQTATYTLVERTATAWRLQVKLLRVAEEQRIVDPSLPRAARTELIALFRQLEGELVVDPRRPLVDHGSFAIESRVHVRIKLPDREAFEQVFEDTGTVRFTTVAP